MMGVIWATKQYWIWLILISLAVMVIEFIAPWRKQQKHITREQFGQDVLWLVLNGHAAGITIAFVADYLIKQYFPAAQEVEKLHLIKEWPLWGQFLVFFILKDLLEWCVHNLLHRVPALWAFHKLHHSIEELDWIGNFRFHWMEIIVYKTLTYLPLVILGVDGQVILWIAILSTIIGDLNHSNLNITWGPLRYLINSPRMHVWHHMYALPDNRHKGVNFGINLSIWDWLFRTSYWPAPDESPDQQPEKLGFPDMDEYPRSFIGRFVYPLRLPWEKRKKSGDGGGE